MIRQVIFDNFYSFQGEQKISFLAQKKKTYDYHTSETGEQITKIAGFVGGNGSGKTNVMRLFSFIGYLVCKSSRDDSELNPNIALKTHFYNTKVSNFLIEFETSNTIFFYNVSIKKNVITHEELSLKSTVPHSRKSKVFSRGVNVVEQINNKYLPNFQAEFIKNIRPDISLIAFLKSHYNISTINRVYDYFSKFKTNINERGEINNVKHQFKALKLYLEDESIKKEMKYILNNFDIGLKDIIIKKEVRLKDSVPEISDSQKTTEEFIIVSGIHQTDEINKNIAFNYESRGTQSLFFTIANILYSLKHESTVIIDEMEQGLHPEALNKLIRYFIDNDKDKKAQIIFSSHSLGFMNQLDMHQIFLVEKNRKSQSTVYQLNQVKNIRSDENFLAKYLSGAYGAFPQIKI